MVPATEYSDPSYRVLWENLATDKLYCTYQHNVFILNASNERHVSTLNSDPNWLFPVSRTRLLYIILVIVSHSLRSKLLPMTTNLVPR